MTVLDARDVAVDPLSKERLSRTGLDYRLVDMTDPITGRAFVRAEARGFLEQDPNDETVHGQREMMAERRNIGVFESVASTGTAEELPVATVSSWVTPMTVPGPAGTHLPMWAISAVTVSGTHRRRGIARNLLEGELRAAVAAGVPVAGLTASEATIYGRYGFGPAIPVARFQVDARRAGGIASRNHGVEQADTVEYLERAALAEALSLVHERLRGQRAGQIPGWPLRWERMAGNTPDEDKARAVRGVRYRDVEGAVRGVLVYQLEPVEGEFAADFVIRHLAAETPEALRALWGFAANHDLVRTITADLRPIDDPLPWLVADQRAVQSVMHDHGWLRILDVPVALAARTYRAPVDLVIRVTDPLGYADGTWRLRIGVDGTAHVTATADAPDIELGVATLSSLYLGGVSASTLRAAGRVKASAPVAEAFDHAFGTAEAPALTIWY